MSLNNITDAKTIDELQELGKLSGREKTIISDGSTTKKLSIDTILGYIAGKTSTSPAVISNESNNVNTDIIDNGGNIIFIPNGQEIPVYQRKPGVFYLEEKSQTSIRTEITLPSSVTVNGNVGLKRV